MPRFVLSTRRNGREATWKAARKLVSKNGAIVRLVWRSSDNAATPLQKAKLSMRVVYQSGICYAHSAINASKDCTITTVSPVMICISRNASFSQPATTAQTFSHARRIPSQLQHTTVRLQAGRNAQCNDPIRTQRAQKSPTRCASMTAHLPLEASSHHAICRRCHEYVL